MGCTVQWKTLAYAVTTSTCSNADLPNDEAVCKFSNCNIEYPNQYSDTEYPHNSLKISNNPIIEYPNVEYPQTIHNIMNVLNNEYPNIQRNSQNLV